MWMQEKGVKLKATNESARRVKVMESRLLIFEKYLSRNWRVVAQNWQVDWYQFFCDPVLFVK